MTAGAARMRWTRAIGRLGQTMVRLRAGQIDDEGDA
jgi:hypothetical protein